MGLVSSSEGLCLLFIDYSFSFIHTHTMTEICEEMHRVSERSPKKYISRLLFLAGVNGLNQLVLIVEKM